MRTFFFVVVLMVMCVGEALSAPPPFLRNPLTTNQLTIGSGISIAGDVLTIDPAVVASQANLTAASNSVVTLSSNNVRMAAGTGGITVSGSGSGGVMTWTINDDDAGGGGGAGTLPMNANQFNTNNPVSIKDSALMTNVTLHAATIMGTNDRPARLTLIGTNIFGAPTNTGIFLTNSEPALVGVQMQAPVIQQWGNGWKTTATAGSQPIGVQYSLEPVQGSTTPTAQLAIRFNTNSSAFGATAALLVSSGGTLTAANAISSSGTLFVNGNSDLAGSSVNRGNLTVGGNVATFNEKLRVTNSTAGIPVGLFAQAPAFATDIARFDHGANRVLTVTTNGIQVGPSGATITNILSATATLDFASQTVGGVEDLPITVAGAADGDVVQIGIPVASIGPIVGSFRGFASNGVVYVRFISTGTTQNPASGIFRAIVTKVL